MSCHGLCSIFFDLLMQLMGCPLSHPGDLEAIDKSFYHSLTTWLEGGDIDGKITKSLFGLSHLSVCQTFLPALLAE